MNIADFLEKDKDSRKIFGKKEIEIVKKQVNGINLTQSEKNRLSQDIRPKLSFMIRAIEFKDEFDLKKNSANLEIMEEAKKTILKDELGGKAEAILVFGSHAEGTQTWRSDIDICVVFKKKISLKEITLFRKRVLGKIHEKVDLQVFNALPEVIKKEVAKNHQVIYETLSFDNMDFTRETILKAADTARLARA